jgi:hypothetical protein
MKELKAFFAEDPFTAWLLKDLAPIDQMKVVEAMKIMQRARDERRDQRQRQIRTLKLKHKFLMRRVGNLGLAH